MNQYDVIGHYGPFFPGGSFAVGGHHYTSSPAGQSFHPGSLGLHLGHGNHGFQVGRGAGGHGGGHAGGGSFHPGGHGGFHGGGRFARRGHGGNWGGWGWNDYGYVLPPVSPCQQAYAAWVNAYQSGAGAPVLRILKAQYEACLYTYGY